MDGSVAVNLVFYARAVVRFDNLEGGSHQRVFDYANGPATNNILLTQVSGTNTIRFSFWKDAVEYILDIPNTIVNHEQAMYVAQIYEDGLMQLLKDGVLIGQYLAPTLPDNEERTNKLVGESNWSHDSPLIGEVLQIYVDEDGNI